MSGVPSCIGWMDPGTAVCEGGRIPRSLHPARCALRVRCWPSMADFIPLNRRHNAPVDLDCGEECWTTRRRLGPSGPAGTRKREANECRGLSITTRPSMLVRAAWCERSVRQQRALLVHTACDGGSMPTDGKSWRSPPSRCWRTSRVGAMTGSCAPSLTGGSGRNTRDRGHAALELSAVGSSLAGRAGNQRGRIHE
jgi:hypothetical protein